MNARHIAFVAMLGAALLSCSSPPKAHAPSSPPRDAPSTRYDAVQVPPGDTTSMSEFAGQISRLFAASVRNVGYDFLTDKDVAKVQARVRDFAERYIQPSMGGFERDRILEATSVYARGTLTRPTASESNGLDRGYIEVPDVVLSFEWRLWRALTRQPLSPEDAARRDAQRAWMREAMNAGRVDAPAETSPAPGAPAHPMDAFDRRCADPLGLLYDPMTDAQFDHFKTSVEAVQRWGGGKISDINPEEFFERAVLSSCAPSHRDPTVPGGRVYDVDLPFDDRVIGVTMRQHGFRLDFLSNALFRGRPGFLPYENARPVSILDVRSSREVYLAEGSPDEWTREMAAETPGSAGWMRIIEREGIGDLYYDGSKDLLVAARGARIALLPVYDWRAADAMTDSTLRAFIRQHGSDSLSAGSDMLRTPYVVERQTYYDSAFFLGIETREKRLAVIRAKGSLRDHDLVNYCIRLRAKTALVSPPAPPPAPAQTP